MNLIARLRNFLAGRRGCPHEALTGYATYYDTDLRIQFRLAQCDACGMYIIHEV